MWSVKCCSFLDSITVLTLQCVSDTNCRIRCLLTYQSVLPNRSLRYVTYDGDGCDELSLFAGRTGSNLYGYTPRSLSGSYSSVLQQISSSTSPSPSTRAAISWRLLIYLYVTSGTLWIRSLSRSLTMPQQVRCSFQLFTVTNWCLT